LNGVFQEWMTRLQKCIPTAGDYVGWPKKVSKDGGI
jgi:hypothetical protein